MVDAGTTKAYGELVAAIRDRRSILFAGAGVSMAVGLPSWTQLIDHMRDELGLSAEESEAGYQTLAEYYRLQQGSVGALRSWMDRTWSVSEDKVAKSAIHKLLVELDFPILYTTNYDNNLEAAYRHFGRDYVKIVSARDLARAGDGATQIVKFHGDFEDDQSLVLAETDYFDRLEFDSPLDIKFRADTLGRTLLFVGYSMSDMNIRLLLHKLRRTWEQSGRPQERPPQFVFVSRPDRVRDAVLEHWGITVLANDAPTPEKGLLAFLKQLHADVSGKT